MTLTLTILAIWFLAQVILAPVVGRMLARRFNEQKGWPVMKDMDQRDTERAEAVEKSGMIGEFSR